MYSWLSFNQYFLVFLHSQNINYLHICKKWVIKVVFCAITHVENCIKHFIYYVFINTVKYQIAIRVKIYIVIFIIKLVF